MTTRKNTLEKVSDALSWATIGALVLYSVGRLIYELLL